MNAKKKPSSESIVREIKRKTRRKYSADEKIRIVLEGLRGEPGRAFASPRFQLHSTHRCLFQLRIVCLEPLTSLILTPVYILD